ncbi:MAG: hypothetical protein PUB87_09490 [Eubacteriaceae bacterium]|nr:hypothetical protein [Eubacteriaceae bacterium]
MLSDTTAIDTAQGKLYVAGIFDLYGDMPVGMAIAGTMRHGKLLGKNEIQMAFTQVSNN